MIRSQKKALSDVNIYSRYMQTLTASYIHLLGTSVEVVLKSLLFQLELDICLNKVSDPIIQKCAPPPPPPHTHTHSVLYIELWSMDSKKAPQDKLSCVSKCCTHLLSALRVSQDGPASADEFLPSFIFMIIYTSPQHVHSNIK